MSLKTREVYTYDTWVGGSVGRWVGVLFQTRRASAEPAQHAWVPSRHACILVLTNRGEREKRQEREVQGGRE